MSVQSRRQLFRQALAVPAFGQMGLAYLTAPVLRCEIVSGDNCLSEESAAGYRSILRGAQISHPARQVIIVTGASNVAEAQLWHLRSRVTRGAWLVWEHPPDFGSSGAGNEHVQAVQRTFGLRVTPAHGPQQSMYLRYHWPTDSLVRTFGGVAWVECLPKEAIAYHDGHAIALKRSIGFGGMIFLGSMLGPHLTANDCEAQELTTCLVKALSSSELGSDTSFPI